MKRAPIIATIAALCLVATGYIIGSALFSSVDTLLAERARESVSEMGD